MTIVPITVLSLALIACDSSTVLVEDATVTKRVVKKDVTLILERPLLVYDVVAVPSPGTVENLSGEAETLTERNGWQQLREGQVLGDEAKLRVAAGAAFVIRFSATEMVQFFSAPEERWVALSVKPSR